MAAFYHIDKDRKLVMSTVSGALTRDDLESHMRKLRSDPDFDPRFSQLADFTHMTKLEVTADDIRYFARTSVFDSDSRRAFIVGDDVSALLAEMFALLRKVAGERGRCVFRTLEEGIEWILPRVTVR